MVITNHAKMRLKQRMGIKKKASYKTAQRAFERGIHSTQTTGSLRKYLDCLAWKKPEFYHFVVYADYVFVYDRFKNLVTVMALPDKYKATAQSQIHQIHALENRKRFNMNKAKMKAIRYDIALSLYHDLPQEQYKQFIGLRLFKESIEGKTYKAIWTMPDGSKTACIILDDYTIPDYPIKVNVTGMTGFAA